MTINSTTEAPAANVTEALCRVMRDLPGIGKDGQAAAAQGGYRYRGIEQITREAQGLFARHGIAFIPRVTSWDVREIEVQGKPWTDTTLMVEYAIVGPNDTRLTAAVVGIGRDNSDKGANKAMTQAFKYAMLQALCISDADDDADGTTHERDADPTRTPAEPEALDDLRQQIGRLDDAAKADLAVRWKARNLHDLGYLSTAELAFARELVKAVGEAKPAEASDPPPAPDVQPPAPEATGEATAPDPGDLEARIERTMQTLAGIPARSLDASLKNRGLITSGGIEDRRRRLAVAMIGESDTPPAVEVEA